MYNFKLPIGDWSGDGHSKCDWFIIKSNKPFEDIKRAFKKAAKDKRLSKVNPDHICHEYGDQKIDNDVWSELTKLGFNPFKNDKERKRFEKDDYIVWESKFMVELVLWFLKQGDPELVLSIVPEEEMPCLGNGFGYGLFE